MFTKIMAGTVTREEGTMLINSLVKENQIATIKELSALIETPPPRVFPKTILHTIVLTRNKVFYNIIVDCLEHKNEDVSIFAAQELARLRTSEAKEVLAEHLNSDVYHVRKASALALADGFGSEGIGILKEHVLKHPEPFYRATSTEALAKAGRPGAEALVAILCSGNHLAVASAAEAIYKNRLELTEEDAPKVIEALMTAGDSKDSSSIVELLQVVASLGKKARKFEGFVRAFSDYPQEEVRAVTKKVLDVICEGA